MTRVNYEDLIEAFDFVNFDGLTEHAAFVSLDTGRVFWLSENDEEMDDVPDDLESSDRYLAVPHKQDLDLGTDRVLRFIDQALPDDYETVRGFFRKRGAYGRFKDLLARRRRLDDWYQFEASAIDAALTEWCADHGIELVNRPGSATGPTIPR